MTLGARLLPAIDAISARVAALSSASARAAAADLGVRAQGLGPIAGALRSVAEALARAAADLGYANSGAPGGGQADALGVAQAAIAADAAALGSAAAAQDAAVAGIAQALADLRAQATALDPPPPKPWGARSGLPWASGERHGNVYQGPLSDPTTGLPAFEVMRGRPADFELVFVDGWRTSSAATWAANCNPLKPVSALPWLASQGIAVVLTVPLFPGLGLDGSGLPAGKQRFADVTSGRYDQVHHDLASRFAAFAGLRVIGLRIGWECNSGNATTGAGYPWSYVFAEGDYGLWRDAYKRVSGVWRAAFPGTLVALNFLRQFPVGAPDGSFTLDGLLQGDTGWFDVLGADCYTNQLGTGATSADVRAYLNAGTPDRPMGPVTWAKAAAARGKLTEVSEWGAARPVFPADNPTRDTGDFPRQMFDLFLSWPHLAWEAYFRTNDPGSAASPGPGYHEIVGPASMLPNTRTGYVSRWMPA